MIFPKGLLTCEITDVSCASSSRTPRAYLRVAGSAWHACLGSGGTADSRAQGMALGPRCPEASNGTYSDELDNQPGYHHTYLLERPNRGPVSKEGWSWVTSLVDKPSSEGAVAKHYLDRLTRRRMERSQSGTRPSGAWPALGPCGRHVGSGGSWRLLRDHLLRG